MKPMLIIINGAAGAGKDTFVDLCKKHTSKLEVVNLHRSDLGKWFLSILGWNGVKTPQVRKLLKDIVDFSESCDFFKKSIPEVLDEYDKPTVVFFHMRDTSKYEEFLRACHNHSVNMKTLLIQRDAENLEPDSWYDISHYPYNYRINNSGSIASLEQSAKLLMSTWEQDIFGGNEHECK